MADWEYDKERAEVTALDAGGVRVRMVRFYGSDQQQIEAHGNLIAAAPDLLKACERALARCPFPVGATRAKSDLKAAIAKAKGEEIE